MSSPPDDDAQEIASSPNALPRATIPPDEAATVQALVKREVENLRKLHETEERIRRRNTLLEQRRRLRLEVSDVKNRLRRLNGWLADTERELRETGAATTE